jgi:Ion channel
METLIVALQRTLRDPEVRRNSLLLAGVVVTAPFFFMWLEGWSFSNAVIFALTGLIQAVSGTEVPTTVGGKVFTLAYVVVVLGIALALLQSLTAGLAGTSAEPDESGGR